MTRLNRRSFLASSAAVAAAPVIAEPRKNGPYREEPRSGIDVVIVGAGAAGVAAARRLAAARQRVIVVESAAQVGGRCITDTQTFDVPFDRGGR